MNKRIIMILTLLVIIPLGLLAWLGVRVASDEEKQIKLAFEEVLQSKMREIDGQIQSLFDTYHQRLSKTADPRITADGFYDMGQLTPFVSQFFAQASDGRMLYPPVEGDLTETEAFFLKRTQKIFDGKIFFSSRRETVSSADSRYSSKSLSSGSGSGSGSFSPSSLQATPASSSSSSSYSSSTPATSSFLDSDSSLPLAPVLVSASDSIPALESPTRPPSNQGSSGLSAVSPPDVNKGLRDLYVNFRSSDPVRTVDWGWFAWHWDSDIHILYWQRKPDNSIFGAELSRSYVISEIIGLLPENVAQDPLLNRASILLRDSNNRLIHRLGTYVPKDSEKPFSTISLSNPLHTWSLQFYPSPSAMPSRLKTSTAFNVFLSLLAVGLTLIGLAAFLFRESNREFQEARKRVSFVNQVSHELKTPLTNIRMFAELLEKHLPEDDPEIGKKLKIIVSESQRLSRLIANVLTFSKNHHQKLTLKPRSACPDEIISATIESFRPSLAAKSIHIVTDLSAKQRVLIDPDVTEQILGNLLSNIEKYAVSGGEMIVASQFEGDRTRICIRDFGPGIPQDKIEFVFQPFTRLSDKLSEGVSGTGIGLPIARDLARLHDGDVKIVWANGPVAHGFPLFLGAVDSANPVDAVSPVSPFSPALSERKCPGFPRVEGVCFEVTLSTPIIKGERS